ncbi:hypothetical protein Tco_1052105 [Tanacetum coccineum]
MTSDHNSLELRIHNHSNELSSSKLVPKVVPPADKTDTSRQELELLFHHHITMLREEMPPKIELTLGSITTRSDASVTRTASTTVKPCQGDSLNLPDHRIHKDGDDDALFQLKTDSLPHAHDIKSYQVKWFSRGFQDDAKSEHEGQDTRRKVGKMRSRRKDKDLKILRTKKTKIKDNDKG